MAVANPSPRIAPPQSFISSYAPRIRGYANALLTPIIEKPTIIPSIRTTKRGTTLINYAEDGLGSDYDDGEDGSRRPTGLRSRREEQTTQFGAMQAPGQDRIAHFGKEVHQPVEVQGIWREWMSKPRGLRTEKQAQLQSSLPLALIPIRIDIDIPAFRPEAPLPAPPPGSLGGIRVDENLPAYKPQELTPGFRLKDVFMWNLWESLCTPDQFAKTFVDEMDFEPGRRTMLALEIARQIREQLEQHASVALNPAFQTDEDQLEDAVQRQRREAAAAAGALSDIDAATPRADDVPSITAIATQDPPPIDPAAADPADTHRCILQLSINLQSHLYTDRVEWSLLHPPGAAETFARQTCADLGLPPEWSTSIAHALYESVLRLKKEVADAPAPMPIYHAADGALATTSGTPLDNDAANELTSAGWRYEPEGLAGEWAPRVEALSKEEIEKREGDRERRLRRARRETARLGDEGGLRRRDDLGPPTAARRALDDDPDAVFGRGERSKKKRRASPSGRDTPVDAAVAPPGALATIGALSETDRARWRCDWCKVWGHAVWGTRDGPEGMNSLCHICGFVLDRDRRLPPWTENMFATEAPAGMPLPRR